MKDFIAKVGRGIVKDVTCMYGLGDRNDGGEMLIQFYHHKNYVIKNTFCKLHPRRLYTFRSPQDEKRKCYTKSNGLYCEQEKLLKQYN